MSIEKYWKIICHYVFIHLLSKQQKKQQGIRFDPDLPQTIRLEFAKSNTKVNKPKQSLPSLSSSSSSAAAVAAAAAAATASNHQAALAMHPLTGRNYCYFFPSHLISFENKMTNFFSIFQFYFHPKKSISRSKCCIVFKSTW